MSLSERIRSGVEAAPWVKDEIAKMEAELASLRAQCEELAAAILEAEALRANLACAWFYGNWKAETASERSQQALMEMAGWWPWADEDALIQKASSVHSALARRKEVSK